MARGQRVRLHQRIFAAKASPVRSVRQEFGEKVGTVETSVQVASLVD